jgi:hypothetical protein
VNRQGSINQKLASRGVVSKILKAAADASSPSFAPHTRAHMIGVPQLFAPKKLKQN